MNDEKNNVHDMHIKHIYVTNKVFEKHLNFLMNNLQFYNALTRSFNSLSLLQYSHAIIFHKLKKV